MPIVGNLKEMPLSTLIETNCRALHSARLSLSHQGVQGEVYFSDGEVVHASLGSEVGESALFHLLHWTDGTFVMENEVPSPEHTVHRPWSDLLLESMLRQGEWEAGQAGAPARPVDEIGRLKQIQGVVGAITAGPDGAVLSADVPEGDGETEAAITVFLGALADQIAEQIPVGAFDHGIVNQSNQHIVVLRLGDRYVGLLLAPQSSPALVLNAARSALAG